MSLPSSSFFNSTYARNFLSSHERFFSGDRSFQFSQVSNFYIYHIQNLESSSLSQTSITIESSTVRNCYEAGLNRENISSDSWEGRSSHPEHARQSQSDDVPVNEGGRERRVFSESNAEDESFSSYATDHPSSRKEAFSSGCNEHHASRQESSFLDSNERSFSRQEFFSGSESSEKKDFCQKEGLDTENICHKKSEELRKSSDHLSSSVDQRNDICNKKKTELVEDCKKSISSSSSRCPGAICSLFLFLVFLTIIFVVVATVSSVFLDKSSYVNNVRAISEEISAVSALLSTGVLIFKDFRSRE